MKSKFLFLSFLLVFNLFFFKLSLSEELIFEGTEIEILDNGTKINATKGIEVKNNNGLKIVAEEFVYDKKTLFLDLINNVVVEDKINKIIIKSKKVNYNKKEDIFLLESDSEIIFNGFYTMTGKKINYNRNKMKIFSNDKSKIKDNLGNTFYLEEFIFDLKSKLLKTKNLKFTDIQNNNYYLEKSMIDFNKNKVIGKDLIINFYSEILGNKENNPRLKGNAIYADKDKTIVKKGKFTTCKKRDGCPPWEIAAEEVIHDKETKTIYYKNAWLNIYDTPVVYFPKFFHPDPTVKRRSGFLIPTFSSSNNRGFGFKTPYYHVVSESSDLTFKPLLYANKNYLLQNEYRKVGEKTDHISDFSIGNDDNSYSSHFFSNTHTELNIDKFDYSELDLKIQMASNDQYLKKYKLKSPIIESDTQLTSYVKFQGSNDNSALELSLEAYENLNDKKGSDKYEYIYPNINYMKSFSNSFAGDTTLNSNILQKKYNTNVFETIAINDLHFKSSPLFATAGLINSYDILFKNVNTKSKNSVKYKKNTETDLQSLFMFQTKYPLIRNGKNSKDTLTPIMSYRFSPNKSKNIANVDARIDINNIYSINRIGQNQTIEGGQSLTIGGEYKMDHDIYNDIIKFNLATVLRTSENKDLPITSTIWKKTSDVVGSLNIKPSDNFRLDYNFSIDNNFDKTNYDSITSQFSVNNFITTFEFLEEKNDIGRKSYVGNQTKYNFNKANSLGFETRKNKETDVTEFYNLIYEYKNDCLVAAVEYNKDYYSEPNLKPEEQIFFSITIKPFGKANSPSLNR